MCWLHHPRFVRVRDSVLRRIRANECHFRKLKNVAFVCGGVESPRRNRLAEYLRRPPHDFLVFFADEIWPTIAHLGGTNALEMERQLADLADVIPIVVESPGTFAELGAFSLSADLRKKLLPILDLRYRDELSFINTGPVRWIDGDSTFGPSIYVKLDSILSAAAEIEDRLGKLPNRKAPRITNLASSPKHLVFFLCDLVAIFAPTPLSHIEWYAHSILSGTPASSIPTLVELARSMGLLRRTTSRKFGDLYFRPLNTDHLTSFQYKKYLNVPSLRTEIVSVMQSVPSAESALYEVSFQS